MRFTHRTATLTTATLALALVAGSISLAAAQRGGRRKVSTEVEHVTSLPTADGLRRAIIGRDDRGPFLTLDEVRGGRAAQEASIEGAMQGRRWRAFVTDADALWPGAWSGDRFQFWAFLDGAWQTCTAGLDKAATCAGTGGSAGSGSGSSADAIAAAKACDAILTDAKARDACAEAVLHAGIDAAPILKACEAAFDGDDGELMCVKIALTGAKPVVAIPACEAAFDGDANELACLDVVAHAAEPAQLVTFCEERENGDDAELACLRKYVR